MPAGGRGALRAASRSRAGAWSRSRRTRSYISGGTSLESRAMVPDLVLDALEARVLGVLIEKELTTPESYPLTLNALVAGCNQKNNRDPVLELFDRDVQ